MVDNFLDCIVAIGFNIRLKIKSSLHLIKVKSNGIDWSLIL